MSLSLSDIKSRLEAVDELKGKTVYYSSREQLSPPYCTYYRENTTDEGADMLPYDLKEQTMIVELYNDIIDEKLEKAVEKQFEDFALEKSESWIEESKEYQIRYSFAHYIK